MNDFAAFIENLAMGRNALKSERAELKMLANASCDGQSAKRVVDFIIDKSAL